jgi:hypothetical protein
VVYDEIKEVGTIPPVKPVTGDDGYLLPTTSRAGPLADVPAGDPNSQYDDVLNLANKQEVGEYHYIYFQGVKQ